MCQVIRFPGHKWVRCQTNHNDGGASCPICSGGLAMCHNCGGLEGSLPTECPGKARWST